MSLESLTSLGDLHLSGVALIAEDFIELFDQLEQQHPRSGLVVESVCDVEDNITEITESLVINSCLPKVSDTFGNKICKPDAAQVEDDLLHRFEMM